MSLFRLIAGLPTVVKFALGGLLVFVAYIGIVEPTIDQMAGLDLRAQEAARTSKALSSRSEQKQQTLSRVTTGERRFGVVHPPSEYEQRVDAFNTRVNDILKDADVRDIMISNRTARAPKGELDHFAGSGQRVERAIKEIRFTATPEQFTSVLSALEQSPEISSVTRVGVQRESSGERRLRVDVAAEAWVLVSDGRPA
jgi:hypothetical protein